MNRIGKLGTCSAGLLVGGGVLWKLGAFDGLMSQRSHPPAAEQANQVIVSGSTVQGSVVGGNQTNFALGASESDVRAGVAQALESQADRDAAMRVRTLRNRIVAAHEEQRYGDASEIIAGAAPEDLSDADLQALIAQVESDRAIWHDSIRQRVDQHLSDRNYKQAVRAAKLAASMDPKHPLITSVLLEATERHDTVYAQVNRLIDTALEEIADGWPSPAQDAFLKAVKLVPHDKAIAAQWESSKAEMLGEAKGAARAHVDDAGMGYMLFERAVNTILLLDPTDAEAVEWDALIERVELARIREDELGRIVSKLNTSVMLAGKARARQASGDAVETCLEMLEEIDRLTKGAKSFRVQTGNSVRFYDQIEDAFPEIAAAYKRLLIQD